MSSTRKTLEHINPVCSLLPEGADTEEAAEAAQPTQAAEAAHMQAAEAAPSTEAAEAVQAEAAAVAGAAEGAAAYGSDLCVSAKAGRDPDYMRERPLRLNFWSDPLSGLIAR
jgi:hypothetical protein